MSTRFSAHLAYSLHYLFSGSGFAFVLAFFPLHCRDIGFSPFEIALISAAATVAPMLGSPLLLQLAHQWAPARRLLKGGMAIAALFFLPLLWLHSFYAVLATWSISILAKRGSDSLVDAQAVRDSAENIIRFERVRTWGSIGFVLITFVLGALTDWYGAGAVVPAGSLVIIAGTFASFCVAKHLAPEVGKHRVQMSLQGDTPRGTYLKPLCALLGVTALIWASHAILYVYLSLYLDSLGWSAAKISIAWNLGVAAEIFFFFSMKYLEPRLSLPLILRISVAATVLRWLILYQYQHETIILFSQLLHGFSFGGCYIASIKLVHAMLPESLKDRGQGLLLAFGNGVGALTGRLHAGVAASSLNAYTEVNRLFLFSALIATVAMLLSLWVKIPQRNNAEYEVERKHGAGAEEKSFALSKR